MDPTGSAGAGVTSVGTLSGDTILGKGTGSVAAAGAAVVDRAKGTDIRIAAGSDGREGRQGDNGAGITQGGNTDVEEVFIESNT